jgi:predicted patatin/cPLA2 family phospholipase
MFDGSSLSEEMTRNFQNLREELKTITSNHNNLKSYLLKLKAKQSIEKIKKYHES